MADWNDANYDEVQEVRLDRWWKGRVFIVGDAAHAMAPDLGQGANAAMVDALVLLRLLAPALQGRGDLARRARRLTCGFNPAEDPYLSR